MESQGQQTKASSLLTRLIRPNILLKQEWILLVVIIVVAFSLRIWKINTDLLYHRDQGLVAMDIYKIWHDKQISLLGVSTDVDGLYHSPFYYWVLTPFYALGNGDVVYPAIAQIVIEVLSLPLLYLSLKKLFNKKAAFLALIFYTFSYGLISYSRWFINPPFILPLTNILLFLLVYKKDIFWSGLLVGMISQTNAAIGVFYLPFLLYYFRKKLNLKDIIKLFSAFLIPAIPLILFQLRHNFVTLKAFYAFASSPKAGVGFSLTVFWNNLVTFFEQVNVVSFYPYVFVSALIFIYGLIKLKDQRDLIYSFLLVPFLFLGIFQRGAIGFFYVAAFPLIIGVVSYAIIKMKSWLILPLIVIFLFLNIGNLKKIYKPTNALIPIGDENLITLQDRKNVIDWMYAKASGDEFALWIYTIPYFQDYPWDYLFITYAKDKYGYLPEKIGSFSRSDLKKSKYFFAVYEVDRNNQSRQSAWFNNVNNGFGETIDRYDSHDIHVEQKEKLI